MKVVLAVDGSKNSEEAAWLLSHLPHQEELQLTILTAVSPPISAFHSPTKQFMDQIVSDDRKYAKTHQSRISEMFTGANATLDCRIVEGRAQECIIECAEQLDADLIVVGAKGHSQIDRILLGSTSDYVATHAPCSVLVVRPTGLREEPDHKLKVAVAYDGSGAAQAALEELLEFDWGANTEITVVAVAGYAPVFNPDFGFNPKTLQEEAQKAVRLASDQLSSNVSTVRHEIIEYDHIAEGLVRHTEEKHSDFIVIGDTGRSSIARALLGSVSRFVLRHARCGVWITRNRAIEGISKTSATGNKKLAGTS